jgi:transcriptional regulator GlxA family with amidase domain
MLVALVAPVGAHSLEIAGPSDVFEEANRQCATGRAYEVRVISEGPGPITAASGLRILPDRTIHDPDEPIDTLVVAGPYGIPAPPSRALVAWLGRRAATARRYGSVCTGAFLLGAAGLLGGRRVATHWRYAPELAAAYPSAIVEPDRIFVRDGPLFSSAGVTAGLDLALALVEEDLGGAVALAVARQLVVFLKRPGGQSQFSVQLAAQTATRSPIRQVQQWIRDDPGADLSIAALSRRAAMSGRNFARVFRRETGMTPADFVEATRVDAARRMLEEGGLPFQRIASECGFTGSDTLRRAFLRRLAVTPRDYRSRFRSDPERPGRGGHPGRPAPVGVG